MIPSGSSFFFFPPLGILKKVSVFGYPFTFKKDPVKQKIGLFLKRCGSHSFIFWPFERFFPLILLPIKLAKRWFDKDQLDLFGKQEQKHQLLKHPNFFGSVKHQEMHFRGSNLFQKRGFSVFLLPNPWCQKLLVFEALVSLDVISGKDKDAHLHSPPNTFLASLVPLPVL